MSEKLNFIDTQSVQILGPFRGRCQKKLTCERFSRAQSRPPEISTTTKENLLGLTTDDRRVQEVPSGRHHQAVRTVAGQYARGAEACESSPNGGRSHAPVPVHNLHTRRIPVCGTRRASSVQVSTSGQPFCQWTGVGAFDNTSQAAIFRGVADMPHGEKKTPFIRQSGSTPSRYLWEKRGVVNKGTSSCHTFQSGAAQGPCGSQC